MYEAVKKTKRLAPKEKLIIKTKEGLTSNEKKAVRNHNKILRKHFLYKRNTNSERIANTDASTVPVIGNKKSSIDSKKCSKKSPGMDQIKVKLIKYSPEVVYEKIACIYNNIAVTRKHPCEITHGIFKSTTKARKNIRKILAVCIMKTIYSRLDSAIPIS